MNVEQSDWVRRRIHKLMRTGCMCQHITGPCPRCKDLQAAKELFFTEFTAAAELYALSGGAR